MQTAYSDYRMVIVLITGAKISRIGEKLWDNQANWACYYERRNRYMYRKCRLFFANTCISFLMHVSPIFYEQALISKHGL